jgi:hypothetical protein
MARLTNFIISPVLSPDSKPTRFQPAETARAQSQQKGFIFLPCPTSICYVGAGSQAQRPSKMTAKLDVQTREGVLLLTIDNPAQRNALTPDFSRAATAALRLAANV